MSNHTQASSSSRAYHIRLPVHGGGRRSLLSSSSREPLNKRPRNDENQSNRVLAQGPPTTSTLQKQVPESSAAKVAESSNDVASDLESSLDEYDLGVDEEEKRRGALEESRKRRQAILEKHRSIQTSSMQPDGFKDSHIVAARTASSSNLSQLSVPDEVNKSAAEAQSRAGFSLVKSTSHQLNDVGSFHHGVSQSEHVFAAELDPDADRAQEFIRLEQRRQSTLQEKLTHTIEHKEEFEEVEITDDEDEEEMDMFALSDMDDDAPKKKKTKMVRAPKRVTSTAALASNAKVLPVSDNSSTTTANLSSNWDDSEGYLRIILGETINDRYQIFAVLGKGMFASVVRARDLHDNSREVAIKIIRVQESMYKAGLKEVSILRKLNQADTDDRKHIVRLEGHFDYKGHLCMVFESLGMNLREVVKRYGRDVGLNMQAVRAYAHQLFMALAHLSKCSVMHADIKPDNILVNDTKALLKLCDLGSASSLSEMEITPYLVSRFYRAPEIILGQAYDCSIDIWSAGCTLYEVATGKILFPGRTNNHMLLLMQELRGRFTSKQIRKSQFGEQHFDDANVFLSMEPDKNTGQNIVRRVALQKPTSDLRSRLLPGDAAKKLRVDEARTMNHLIDLLERCLELDPAKRIKPKEALEHAFLAHMQKQS
ncbi:related to mRNA splicing-associated serine-threonine protein kinase [Melanopsichium pennsylvanicum]|uniref:non-specific serine/threonine protein kinase n=2 Tax=Melanopsichium pennsylvanicum TaxID=63383 RepID=A0AAJ4XMJ0_9BASI|nr:related to mRNA splicing-associated serine-threonine protein kinase [Melanopsichium pennsylvanicum 4]SNX85584.1 related to mRNA splicing-associated serine-threonine protein kinase [Melanopsichium pennsylvanicum]